MLRLRMQIGMAEAQQHWEGKGSLVLKYNFLQRRKTLCVQSLGCGGGGGQLFPPNMWSLYLPVDIGHT